jgi:hypothetical protein
MTGSVLPTRITQLGRTDCENVPMPPPEGEHAEHPVAGMLGSIHEQLRRIEELVAPDLERAGSSIEARVVPAWRRSTEGEHRLPVAIAVVVAIVLQLVLPIGLVIGPSWLFPALEGLLLIGLIAANPRRINRTSTLLRTGSISLIALLSLANAWSSGELIRGIIDGTSGAGNASVLLARGASIYVTNIIVFGLWYWEWDGAGRSPERGANARTRTSGSRRCTASRCSNCQAATKSVSPASFRSCSTASGSSKRPAPTWSATAVPPRGICRCPLRAGPSR